MYKFNKLIKTQHFDTLIYTITLDEANDICLILSNCMCCNRHQNNKPNRIENNYKNYPINISNLKINIPKCKCNCRHISRKLNKFFSNTII